MSYELREMTGSLFRNERKEAETHADYRGSAKIAGIEYFLDAWINTSANGTKYMSLKLKPKTASSGRGESRQPYEETLDDDVPF